MILGDTCDSKSMMAAAQEADVVVHEATVLEQDASEVLQRGHSTASMHFWICQINSHIGNHMYICIHDVDGPLPSTYKRTTRTSKI